MKFEFPAAVWHPQYEGTMENIEKAIQKEATMDNKLYKLMNWPGIEEIVYSECDHPHDLLGPHKAGSQTLVQAFYPGAD